MVRRRALYQKAYGRAAISPSMVTAVLSASSAAPPGREDRRRPPPRPGRVGGSADGPRSVPSPDRNGLRQVGGGDSEQPPGRSPVLHVK